ncbi:MAG: energy-coupling factor transporter transmembrane protein EcfT [Candidatus Thiodiazotropha sp. (ex Lucinoma borealis)]|nr:energy-coupling factor transporter transmembrane protein EcfT [Candidatus Thiodiazotropha sp. (ex Lucinoma borealis)]MCU7865355.1 energy-coupling factor transporter transmembrane protein EcfT [Candidatus Thiodiazotropha sp. (ex Lucinoma borealis)]
MISTVKHYRSDYSSFKLPIDSLRPATKIILIATLPIGIFSNHLTPILVALLVTLIPWRGSELNKTVFKFWGTVSIFAMTATGIILIIQNEVTSHIILSSIRVCSSILLIGLLAERYKNAVLLTDLLHISAKLGGHRYIALPLLAANRFLDILEQTSKNIVLASRSRSLFDKRRDISRADVIVGMLVTYFASFFKAVDEMALSIDMRIGTDSKILVYVPGQYSKLDLIFYVFLLLYLVWAFI